MHAIEIFPNPAQDIVYYSLNEGDFHTRLLTLTDASGKVLLTQEAERRELNIAHLPAGVYFLQIQASGLSGIATFVKNE